MTYFILCWCFKVNLSLLYVDSVNHLVNHIENLKGKVIDDLTIKKFCDEISQLSTSANNLMTENKKISSQLMVLSNANTLLVTCVTELEKQQTKMEQLDENLEKKLRDICKELGIDLFRKSLTENIRKLWFALKNQ